MSLKVRESFQRKLFAIAVSAAMILLRVSPHPSIVGSLSKNRINISTTTPLAPTRRRSAMASPANQEVAAHRIAGPAQHLGKHHETNELGGARNSAAN